MIVTNRVVCLPADFSHLVAAANAESMQMMERLATDYKNGMNRFDGPGEGLWEARSTDQLIGVCGLNEDPFAAAEERCGRVRRLYVHPQWRRRGIASALLDAVTTHAADHFSKLTAFTVDTGVVSFYQACGFRAVDAIPKRSVEYDL